MTVPDRSLERRVAYLERRLQEMEMSLARQELLPAKVTPLAGRLWRFTLNADISSGTASADLLELGGDDTNLDVTVTDANGRYAGLKNTCAGLCVEQLDLNGTRKFIIIDVPLKQFCRFTAGGDFDTSDSSVSGTIVTQFGQGQDHPSTSATFNNLETSTGLTYVFEGDEDDAGLALYSGSGTTWYIVQMECP